MRNARRFTSKLHLVLPPRPTLPERPGTVLALMGQVSRSISLAGTPGNAVDEQSFLSRVNAALSAKAEGRLDDAAAGLRGLVRDLSAAGRTAVGEWHQQQALSLLVDALDAAGREEECREAWEELVRFVQHAQTYWQSALSAAREDFARWDRKRASGTGKRGGNGRG